MPTIVETFKFVRESGNSNHDLYWVAQLYEENWVPGPIA